MFRLSWLFLQLPSKLKKLSRYFVPENEVVDFNEFSVAIKKHRLMTFWMIPNLIQNPAESGESGLPENVLNLLNLCLLFRTLAMRWLYWKIPSFDDWSKLCGPVVAPLSGNQILNLIEMLNEAPIDIFSGKSEPKLKIKQRMKLVLKILSKLRLLEQVT